MAGTRRRMRPHPPRRKCRLRALTKDSLAAWANSRENGGAMTLPPLSLAVIVVLALAGPATAAPLVLYDQAAATPPAPGDLKSTTTTNAVQPCGLTTPCTDMNTSAQASLAAPLGSNFTYGMSGEASAGVSNHGQGGEIGVLAWMKAGDTTLSLGLSYGESRWNGRGYSFVPVPQHP